ncbi:MAG: ATP-binding cassette domain-containing protein [Fuerstiella sp.]|nr:ATP-binding cassette domain-containing protein [Fuerstiella sp.]MCP4858375.1 ATP-binding cassette domain-containing protein [Fuerstiella sp.]
MNAEPVVRIQDLHKQFEFTEVLKGVSLDVRAGSIVGLLGANAAGKSTLIRHMVGLYLPDQGGPARLWDATRRSSGLTNWRASGTYIRKAGLSTG